MTAILTLKGDDGVYIAADSRCLYGLSISEDVSKIVFFPHFAVANTGIATASIIIEEFSKDTRFLKKKFCKMENTHDAAAFAREVNRELKDRLCDAPGDTSQEFTRLLIATPKSIYLADEYGYSYESETFIAEGCGGPYITGFLAGIYEPSDDMNILAKSSIEVAINRSAGCGGNIHIHKIDESVCPGNPKRKPVAKKKKPTPKKRKKSA